MKLGHVLAFTLAGSVTLGAQAPAAPAPAVPPVPVVPIGSRVGDLPTGYDSGGRRDPFASLVVPKKVASPTSSVGFGRPRSGLVNVQLADVTVKGIVRNGRTMLAILETPSKQSYVARPNDRLADAQVHSIDAEGVIFADGGAGSASRVRKELRTSGEEFR